MTKSIWETLSKIDVSSYTENKNGFTYLSWAHAWREVKNIYPQATFNKHVDEVTGSPVFLDPNGNAFVAVTVTIKTDDEIASATEVLPVLDFRNKAIPNPNAFDTNKALQRCLTKALAYLGLAFYLYVGEDLPESEGASETPKSRAHAPETKREKPKGWY
jgi:hypothetical protein